MSVQLRAIQEFDWQAFRALRLEALRTCPTAFGSDYTERSADPDSVWSEQIRQSIIGDELRIFLADENDELAGMLGVMREKGVKNRHAAYIWGVYIRPAFRGQKLSERLLGEALDWCRQQAINVIRLTVNAQNAPAIRCYHRAGFQTYGLQPMALKIDGVYHDELMMWKHLGE